jgi:hypothetical protein
LKGVAEEAVEEVLDGVIRRRGMMERGGPEQEMGNLSRKLERGKCKGKGYEREITSCLRVLDLLFCQESCESDNVDIDLLVLDWRGTGSIVGHDCGDPMMCLWSLVFGLWDEELKHTDILSKVPATQQCSRRLFESSDLIFNMGIRILMT